MRSFFLTLLLLPFSFLISFAQNSINTDVLVVGGSTGGTAAGIQCARMGVRTIIIEQTTWLGGMLTAAGVSCTDGNDELPSGMWQEFREALYHHYNTRNLFTGWVSETCFEPHVGDSIFKAWAAKEKKLSVLYGWYFEKVIKQGNKVKGAVFKNKSGEQITVSAILTIDGTDLGDVFAVAGAGYDVGMEDKSYSKESMAPGKFNIIQDITLAAVLIDYGKGVDATIARPIHYDSTLYFCCCTDAPCIEGEPYKVNAGKMLDYGRLPDNKFMLNWPAHGNDSYVNVVNLKPIEREKALQSARNKTLGFVYFIQTQLGFKNIGLSNEFATVDKLALMPYHREGRRMRGVVRLNANHLTHPFDQPEQLYRTGIAVGDYPVDHHHAPEKKAPAIHFPRVPSFNVPLGALIPEKIEGMIVCEKGISVSNIVNGSTRLQPCVLLTGQAGGILAAKCIKENKSPRAVPVRDVQKELLKIGAYIMPYVDVKPEIPYWTAIQKIGATGIIKGIGKPEGWANKTFFYPDSSITVKEFTDGLNSFYQNRRIKTTGEEILTIEQAFNILLSNNLITDSGRFGDPGNLNAGLLNDMVWTTTMGLNNFDRSRPIKRNELAVLIDYFSLPFSRPIDFKGSAH